MTNSRLAWVGIFSAVLVLVAFALPWAQTVSAGRDVELIQKKLLEYQPSPWADWLGMRGEEWNALLEAPAQGVSAYQLFWAQKSHNEASRIAKSLSENLFGAFKFHWGLFVLALPALLALFSLYMLLSPVSTFRWVLMGVIHLLCYVVMRLKWAELDVFRLNVAAGIGWWLTVYGILLLGIIFLLLSCLKKKAPAPSKRKSRSSK